MRTLQNITRSAALVPLGLWLAACSGRGISYLQVDYQTYMYAGSKLNLIYAYPKGYEARVTLSLRNQRTQRAASQSLIVPRDAPQAIELTSPTLPDLDLARPAVEWYGLEAQVEIPGNYWDGLGWAGHQNENLSTEFAIVTDREARLPVFPRMPVFDFISPIGAPADRWAQVEDKTRMEDAVLQAAAERGGRDLVVTSRLATPDEIAAVAAPGFSELGAEIYRFEVRGRFPKQVVIPPDRSVRGGEAIATPQGFTMLVPRVANPPTVDVRPIL